jgi:hypothetical protein
MDQYIDRSDGGEKTGERISISNWGEIIDRTAQLVRSFRNLPMHFVITTLSAERFVGDEENQRRVVRPELSGRTLPNTLAQFFNLVGYAYTRSNKDGIDYRVLLGGNVDFLTKGMPGLAYREIPNIEYWIERSFNRCDPIDPDAPMFPWPGEKQEKQKSNDKGASTPENAEKKEAAEDTPKGDNGAGDSNDGAESTKSEAPKQQTRTRRARRRTN